MTYRDEKQALEDRVAALKAKLASVTDEKGALEAELAQARRDLSQMQPDSKEPERQEPGRSQKRRRGAGLVAGLFLIGILVAIIVLSSVSSRSPAPAAVKVPLGLKGLRFGMTPVEASAVLKQIAPAPTSTQCDAEPFDRLFACRRELERWRELEDEPELPGPRRTMETLLFGEPARCYLSFAVRQRLSRIACRLDVPRHKIAAVWQQVRTKMVTRWGQPSTESDARCAWENGAASLRVRAPDLGLLLGFLSRSRISVVNTWRQHDAARTALQERRGAAARRAQEATEREAERSRQREIERLRRLESPRPEKAE